jgi:hypothetical protein
VHARSSSIVMAESLHSRLVMKKQLAVMFLASVFAAACTAGDAPSTGGGNGDGTGGGGGGNGSGGGGGSSISATNFLAQMAQKFCDEAFMCKASFPTDAGTTFDQAFGASAQACVADAAMYDMPAQVEAQIVAGKIKFNGADAAACVAGITFPACADFWANGPMFPAACANAMLGTIADGGACVVDYECSSNTSYCDATTKKCTADAGNARYIPQL